MFRDSIKRRKLFFATALAGAVTMSMTAAGTAQGALVAHYRLDEPAGSTGPVTDSADSHDGSDINSPTRGVPGVFNTAYSFDKSNEDGVSLGNNSAVQPTGDFTSTFWFNVNGVNNGSKFDRFIGAISDNSSGTQRGYRVFLGGANEVTLVTKHGGGSDPNANSGVVPTAGDWYFTAVRYDTDGEATIAVLPQMSGDASAGDIMNATVDGGAANGPISYGTGETQLAHRPSGSSNSLDGQLDDVAFFDNIQTNQQLADIYNNGAGSVVPEPATLALLGLGGLSMLGRRRRRHV